MADGVYDVHVAAVRTGRKNSGGRMSEELRDLSMWRVQVWGGGGGGEAEDNCVLTWRERCGGRAVEVSRKRKKVKQVWRCW